MHYINLRLTYLLTYFTLVAPITSLLALYLGYFLCDFVLEFFHYYSHQMARLKNESRGGLTVDFP